MGKQLILSGDNARLLVDESCVEVFKNAGYRLVEEEKVQATESEKPKSKRKKKTDEEVKENVR